MSNSKLNMSQSWLQTLKLISAVGRVMITLFIVLPALGMRGAQASSMASVVYIDVANNSGVEDGTQAHPFNTIREGMNSVAEGGTVFVYPGTYAENLDIHRKSLALVSIEGPTVTIIDGSARASVVSMYSALVIVDGFTIQNAGKDATLMTLGRGIDIV